MSRKFDNKNGNDKGTTLELLERTITLTWKPRMQLISATTTDEEDCAADNRKYDIEFKADYDDACYSKRVLTYKNNNTKENAVIWE
jgi:hypothetical protein